MKRQVISLMKVGLLLCSVKVLAGNDQLNLRSTPLFPEGSGHLEQMLAAHVPGTIAPGARLTLKGPGYTLSRALSSLGRLKVGRLGLDAQRFLELADAEEDFLFPVPEIRERSEISAQLQNGKQVLSGTFVLEPQRKWEIHVIHHTHTDAGYTDITERVRRHLAAQYKTVLADCRATDNFPSEARFRWVVESFWPLEYFWREASESERTEFLKYVREGRIEVTAAYLPHLSDIAGHESLLRFFFSSVRFLRAQGLPVRSATFSDSTGYAWIIPQILNSMGIRYISTAVNATRALNPFTQVPRPFYWESPDGSRALVWNADNQMAYPEGYQLRLAHSYGTALPMIVAYLERLQKSGYPYSELGLRTAQDNQGPAVTISDTIRDWNAHWRFPRLIFSTNYQFLHTMEERHGTEIPTYRAAWPDWWTDYYLCAAEPTGVLRLSHEWLSAAERLTALTRLRRREGIDTQSLNVARERTLVSDEPVWGYQFAADRPQDWRTRGASSEKITDIYTGAVNARAVATEAASTLFSEFLNTRALVVFNPLGWPRNGTVQVDLPWEYNLRPCELAAIRSVRDKETGEVLPLQLDRTDNVGPVVSFRAQNVPAMGYRTYELLDRAADERMGETIQVARDTIENEFYRIRVDEKRGGIISIYDKELKSELVDATAPYAFNQYIYERPPHGDFQEVWGGKPGPEASHDDQPWLKRPNFERYVPALVAVSQEKKGPVSYSLVVEGSTAMTPLVRQEIILQPSVKRIDIVNTIRKEEVVAAEAAYFAFPFAVENPVVRFEGADTIITPDQGQLPLSARDWYAVQHWVKLSDGTKDIIWAPLEAPLVQFGGIHTHEWLKALKIGNGSLYSFVMCNYWMTNTQPSQGGEMTFRYSFTSQRHTSDDVPATRFGWDQLSPLVVVGPLGFPGPWLPPPATPSAPQGAAAGSFCHISDLNILLVSSKIADDGVGYVVRLLEFSGKSTRADIRFGPLAVSRVVPADASEQEQPVKEGDAGSVKDGAIIVKFRPYELKTLRVIFKE